MKTFTLRSQFCFLKHTNPTANPPFLIPIKTTSHQKNLIKPSSPSVCVGPRTPTLLLRQITSSKQSHKVEKPLILDLLPKSQPRDLKEEFSSHVLPNGSSSSSSRRFLILGAVTGGFLLFLSGVDDEALALGPEGPLMEEFWDNMRRYALYILTVSTGVAYTIFQPIVELLKNPISAILILTIFGGSIYIVSQVLSAMVGVSDFNYEYGY